MLKAKVKWTGGLQFVGQSGTGHAIVMDGSPDYGGENSGMRPMELLLVGLGGCSGMDIASILAKKKQDVRGIEINVNGKQPDEYPKRFTEIEIEFIVKGKNLSEEAVKGLFSFQWKNTVLLRQRLNIQQKLFIHTR